MNRKLDVWLLIIIAAITTACNSPGALSSDSRNPQTPRPVVTDGEYGTLGHYYATAEAGGAEYQIQELPAPELTPTMLPADINVNPLLLAHPVLMIPEDGSVPYVYPPGYPIVKGMPTMRLPSANPTRVAENTKAVTWTAEGQK